MSSHRILSYSLAINEALHQTMAADPAVFLIGQGVKSPWYVGNTASGLLEQFGERRVIDTPVSENGITGAAVGAAPPQAARVAPRPLAAAIRRNERRENDFGADIISSFGIEPKRLPCGSGSEVFCCRWIRFG